MKYVCAVECYICALCNMKHSANVNTVNVQSGFVCFVEANMIMNTVDISVCAAGNSKHMASLHHDVHSMYARTENKAPCC